MFESDLAVGCFVKLRLFEDVASKLSNGTLLVGLWFVVLEDEDFPDVVLVHFDAEKIVSCDSFCNFFLCDLLAIGEMYQLVLRVFIHWIIC